MRRAIIVAAAAVIGTVTWLLIGLWSDLDRAMRHNALWDKSEHQKLSKDEESERDDLHKEFAGAFFPQISARVATNPLWGALIGAGFVGLWGMICWGVVAFIDPRLSGESLAVRGVAVIGFIVGAIIGGIAGLLGGALALLFPPLAGLAVYGLFFGCAAGCVLAVLPKRPASA